MDIINVDILCVIVDAADTLTAMRMLAVSKQLYAARKQLVEQRILDDDHCYLEDLGFTAIYKHHSKCYLSAPTTSLITIKHGCLIKYPVCEITDIKSIGVILTSPYQYLYVRKNAIEQNNNIVNKYCGTLLGVEYIKENQKKPNIQEYRGNIFTIFGNIAVVEVSYGLFQNSQYQIATRDVSLRDYRSGWQVAFGSC